MIAEVGSVTDGRPGSRWVLRDDIVDGHVADMPGLRSLPGLFLAVLGLGLAQ